MKRKTIDLVLVALFLAAGPACAGEPKELTDKQIQDLVAQLGADNVVDRRQAVQTLQQAGTRAMKALEGAKNSRDAQVRDMARWLYGTIRIQSVGNIDYLDVVPQRVVLAAHVRNVADTLENAKKTALGKLVLSPEMAEFRAHLAEEITKDPDRKKFFDTWVARFQGQLAAVIVQFELVFFDESRLRVALLGEITDPDPRKVFQEFCVDVAGLEKLDTYLDVEIRMDQRGRSSAALVGRHLVFAPNPESVKLMIDRFLAEGKDGFKGSASMARLKPIMGADPDLLITMDMADYLNQIGLTPKLMKATGFDPAFLAITSAVRGEGFEDRVAAILNGRKTGMAAAMTTPEDAPPPLNSMAEVPADAVAAAIGYLDGVAMQNGIMEFLTALEPNVAGIVSGFEKQTGVSLVQMALGIKGDFGCWAILGTDGIRSPPDLGMMVTSMDKERAAITSKFAKSLLHAREIAAGARTIYQFDLAAIGATLPPKFSYTPCWAVDGNRLYFSSSVAALRRQLTSLDRKSPGLLTKPDFIKAMGLLSPEERKGPLLYVDMKNWMTAAARAAVPELKANAPNEKIKAALDALPQPQELFKDIPALLITCVDRDRPASSVTVLRGPVPPFFTLVSGMAGFFAFSAVKADAGPPPGPF